MCPPRLITYRLQAQEWPSTTAGLGHKRKYLPNRSVLASGTSVGKAVYLPDVAALGLTTLMADDGTS